MKSKAILACLIAVFTVSVLASFAAAAVSGDLNLTIEEVTLNSVDVTAYSDDVSVDVGETIPVRVHLRANQYIEDATLTVSIMGEDSEDETEEFEMYAGKTYSKYLSLNVPSSLDEDPSASYLLEVSIVANNGYRLDTYEFTVQRKSNSLELVSVEATRSVTAGSLLSVDVVVKNRGAKDSEDTFVTVRIPALNLEKKAYFSDLASSDVCNGYCDEEDAAERVLTLKIPSDAKAGIYNLEVEAYNSDTSTKTTKTVVVEGSEQISEVLTASTSKDVNAGESVTYDLVLVNSGDRIAIYEIVPETAQNLVVEVDNPIATVPADSSKVVKVTATAGNVMGTFNFAVNVNSQGQLVKRVNLAANVKKGTVANNIVVLTIVLAVIFVVLLIVLIVLLTRKPEKTEEFGESYY